MRGPEYSANPVGVPFEPALMRQALDEGASASEITTLAWASRVSPDLPDPMAVLTS